MAAVNVSSIYTWTWVEMQDKFKEILKPYLMTAGVYPKFVYMTRTGGYIYLQDLGTAIMQHGRFCRVAENAFPTHVVETVSLEALPWELQVAGGGYTRFNDTTGWDPEIFVVDAKDNLLPAFRFLPSKADVSKMYGASLDKSAVAYWDGFQAEFRTSAQYCHGYGVDYLRIGLSKVLQAAHNVDSKAKLSIKSLFRIPKAVRDSETDDHVALGCDPSENAYGATPIEFKRPRTVMYRAAGGHIHFGGGALATMSHAKDKTPINNVVKQLDRYVALPCVALFDGIDDPRRRQYYGRAGEFRTPKHGLEYRTLSNAWLSHPAFTHFVMNLSRGALALRGKDPAVTPITDDEVRDIIDNCDAAKARKWVEANWKIIATLAGRDMGQTPSRMDKAKRFFIGGLKNELREYDNIDLNWKLTRGDWLGHSDSLRASWGSYCQTI